MQGFLIKRGNPFEEEKEIKGNGLIYFYDDVYIIKSTIAFDENITVNTIPKQE